MPKSAYFLAQTAKGSEHQQEQTQIPEALKNDAETVASITARDWSIWKMGIRNKRLVH